MRVAFHITFYFDEKRLVFLNQVIEGLNTIPGDNTIFIYTNKNVRSYIKEDKGNIEIVKFNYSINVLKPLYKRVGFRPYNHWSRKIGVRFFIHPYFLTWESRNKMRAVADAFDAQAYMEDDILFTDTHFKYWLDNNDLCLRNNFSLGFLRYEVDRKTDEVYYHHGMSQSVKEIIWLEGKPFLLNDDEPYSAFWIMDKIELKAFMKSPEWRFEAPRSHYGEREIAAIGWQGLHMKRYYGTLTGLVKTGANEYQVAQGSLLHHLPDNYIGHHLFCKIKHPLILREEGNV